MTEQTQPTDAAMKLVDELIKAEASKTRTHAKYMGIAMPDDVYERFTFLRDECIPELRAKIRAAFTTPQPTQAQAGVEVPAPQQELVGDASMAHEQCRAVVHLALMLAEVYAANAAIVAHNPNLADQIGYASAQALEWIGDELNATDATTEDDEWVDPIIEAAQERWPTMRQANSGSLPEINEINDLQSAPACAWAVPLTQYRVLESRVDRIEAEDEFLQDDAQTWATDPNGTFVGTIYGYALRAARRRIKGADHG